MDHIYHVVFLNSGNWWHYHQHDSIDFVKFIEIMTITFFYCEELLGLCQYGTMMLQQQLEELLAYLA